MRELNEARNKFVFRNFWTSDGNITYRVEGDTKTKIYFE